MPFQFYCDLTSVTRHAFRCAEFSTWFYSCSSVHLNCIQKYHRLNIPNDWLNDEKCFKLFCVALLNLLSPINSWPNKCVLESDACSSSLLVGKFGNDLQFENCFPSSKIFVQFYANVRDFREHEGRNIRDANNNDTYEKWNRENHANYWRNCIKSSTIKLTILWACVIDNNHTVLIHVSGTWVSYIRFGRLTR